MVYDTTQGGQGGQGRPTPDDERLVGRDELIQDGLTPEEADAVLGGRLMLPRWEAEERWTLLLRERGDRP